jgi:hypothetical protein
VILIELNDDALQKRKSSAMEVKQLLGDFNYLGWIVGRKALLPIQPFQAIHHCDECLFIHRDNRPLMQKLGLPE